MTNPKSVRVRALLVAMLVACPFSAPPAAMAHTPAPSGGQVLVGEPAVYEMRLPDPETLKPLAEAGDLKAQFELSQVYAWGEPQDFKASEYWLRRAADAGYVPAQADLGMGLGLGAGATGRLPHEPVEGLMWLILASQQKSDQKGRIEALFYALRRQMKLDQVKEAERRAQEYRTQKAR